MLLEQQPNSAALRCNLADELLHEAAYERAIEMASSAIWRETGLVNAWLTRATAYRALGWLEEALSDYEQAASLAPTRASIAVSIASCLAEVNRLEDAERWLRKAVKIDPASKEAQANLGSVLVLLGRLAEAEAPCLAALEIDDNLITPRQNLSAILAERDPAAARKYRDRAYGSQQIFLDQTRAKDHRILVLAAADAANVPLQHLLLRRRYTVIRWYIEYAKPGQPQCLPTYDIALNSIGDPDFIPDLSAEIDAFIADIDDRLLNSLASIRNTARHSLPAVLGGLSNTLVPAVMRVEHSGAGFARLIGVDGIRLPVLVRPLGSHGGTGLVKVDHERGFAAIVASSYYVTNFVDFKSEDGLYRKYRAIYIDGKVFPYHLAISSSWLVHYWTSSMEQHPGRRIEEEIFLSNPEAAIGCAAWRAVFQIGERLGLDYGGIDFGLLEDGTVLVFEANATMLIHPETDPMFDYRNPAVKAIQSAFHQMIDRRCLLAKEAV